MQWGRAAWLGHDDLLLDITQQWWVTAHHPAQLRRIISLVLVVTSSRCTSKSAELTLNYYALVPPESGDQAMYKTAERLLFIHYWFAVVLLSIVSCGISKAIFQFAYLREHKQ